MTALQLSLAYRPSYLAREAQVVRLEAIRAAVLHLGHKEVAYELDVAGSYLSDALNERDRKRWADEWTGVLLVMLAQRGDDVSTELSRKIQEPHVALSPFALADRVDMTDAEIVAWGRSEHGRAALAATKRSKR